MCVREREGGEREYEAQERRPRFYALRNVHKDYEDIYIQITEVGRVREKEGSVPVSVRLCRPKFSTNGMTAQRRERKIETASARTSPAPAGR